MSTFRTREAFKSSLLFGILILIIAYLVTLVPHAFAQNAGTEKIMFEGITDSARPAEVSIYEVNADGTRSKKLTTDGDGVLSPPGTPLPEWSPDGRYFAFINSPKALSGGFVATELYSIDRDGANRRLLMRVPEIWGQATQQITGVAWSPDGKELAVTRVASGLLLVPASGQGEPQLLLPGNGFNSPAWSLDGRKLAYFIYSRGTREGGNPETVEINIVNADGSGDIQVSKPKLSEPYLYDTLGWSPDGKKIYFVLLDGRIVSIHSANADGSDDTELTAPALNARYSALSPDGKRIAFSARAPSEPAQMFVMNADGSGIRQLTSDQDWTCFSSSSWSSDGTLLTFSCRLSRDACGTAVPACNRIFVISPDNPPAKLTPLIDRDAARPMFAPGP